MSDIETALNDIPIGAFENGVDTTSWTPAFSPASGTFDTLTYNQQTGRYGRVGNLVFINGALRTSNVVVGTASGNLSITGLPVAAVSGASQSGDIGFVSDWGGDAPISGLVVGGTTTMSLYFRSTSNGDSSFLNVSDLTTGASSSNQVFFSAFYFAA